MSRFLLPLAFLLALMAGGASTAAHASSAPSQGVTLAIDADATGNGPRTVGAVDACVPATVGQPINVDIVLPTPGIPPALGLSGFEFMLYFDSRIVSVTADNASMLMAQAPGSRVLPFTSEIPNTSGQYHSVAADFGAQGIEPAGSSETGPGVLDRLTLTPMAEGDSDLVLRQVSLADDASHMIPVDSGQQARVVVGAPCVAASSSPSPAPTPLPSAPAGTPTPAPPRILAKSSAITPPPPTASAGPVSLGDTGGPPSADITDELRRQHLPIAKGGSAAEAVARQRIAEGRHNTWKWPLLAGVLASAAGAALIAGGWRWRSSRSRE